MTSMSPSPPADLDREFVLRRCRYFATIHLWPTAGEGFDPERWLGNFGSDEERHTVYLLNAYLYFSGRLIDRIFVEAFQSLSRAVCDPHAAPGDSHRTWRAWVENVIVVPVRGERPNPSDSGALFVRRARDLLHIDEQRLVEPNVAHQRLVAHPDTPVAFVDDFLGSGSQFITTWRRASPEAGVSFEHLAARGAGRYFYCPVVATSFGLGRVTRECPAVEVHAGHLLPSRYSAVAPDSLIWPSELRPTATEFVRTASQRAGIPDDPSSTKHWEGWQRLGLALGFEHGTPDATLPLLYWDRNGWQPLWKR
jgi:hypothetical protein